MKKLFYPLIVTGLVLVLTNSCGKDEESPNTLKDAEGNVYKIVTIGTQTWMAENLKTTKYRDKATIPIVTDNTWAGLGTGALCWYNNDMVNKNVYGALYNWYAVNTGKLCPAGWHVPSDAEWTTLSTFLGGETVAGGKMKTTNGWNSPNSGATNSSGFSGLAGGHRDINYFSFIGSYGYWWSSTENSPVAWYWGISYNNAYLSKKSNYKTYGFSVRCLRGN